MKVLMAAPFEANGRFEGGIGSVVNTMLLNTNMLQKQSLDIIQLNTCMVKRTNGSDKKLGIANLKNSMLIYKSAVKSIKENNPDVLYYHSSINLALLKDLLIVRHAKRKTKIKTIVHIHAADYNHIMTSSAFLNKFIMRFLNKYVDHIVFLSKNTMEKFISLGINKESCDVIYNFSTLTLDDKDGSFISNNEKNIRLLYVGSIEEKKGIFDLINVVREIKSERVVLHVCGRPFTPEIEKQFNEMQEELGDKLIYHGFVKGEEKIQIFKDTDILVLPSYAEGFPMVILEAFTTGCAVIATSVGAIPEILGKENGRLISPGDKKALEEAILYYLNNDVELASAKQENIIYSKQFSCDEFIIKTSKVCKKVVNK